MIDQISINNRKIYYDIQNVTLSYILDKSLYFRYYIAFPKINIQNATSYLKTTVSWVLDIGLDFAIVSDQHLYNKPNIV